MIPTVYEVTRLDGRETSIAMLATAPSAQFDPIVMFEEGQAPMIRLLAGYRSCRALEKKRREEETRRGGSKARRAEGVARFDHQQRGRR